MVLTGHKEVPSQGTLHEEDRLEDEIVQFPLVIRIEGPAEHVHEGNVGTWEVCCPEHDMVFDAPVPEVDSLHT